MCGICGCDHEHDDEHDHVHEHGHRHQHEAPRLLRLEADLLAKNDRSAERNRGWFERHQIFAVNLMGAPGAGKTTLLEESIRRLRDDLSLAVLEGDQASDRDALRIRSTGCPVVQINTGAGCHLDAEMVFGGLDELDPDRGTLLLIENVGNLVCPAMFDLGEQTKVLVSSITEGEDKPLKYPHMFRAAGALVVNKIDLLPYLDFDLDAFFHHARAVNPHLSIFTVSSSSGEGLDEWCEFLRASVFTGAAA